MLTLMAVFLPAMIGCLIANDTRLSVYHSTSYVMGNKKRAHKNLAILLNELDAHSRLTCEFL